MSESDKNRQPIHFVHRLLRARQWQDRSEFDQVCDWWGSGPAGVCALVGIGGAGKTAIVNRLLQIVLRISPEHAKSLRTDLSTPERLFVFSFYDAPNTDAFFAELARWIQSDSPAEAMAKSYRQTVDLLASANSCTLVLDGLENVQSDGTRDGRFGQIPDGRLRDLVLRSADGSLPNVSLLITSRFRLSDSLPTHLPLYRQINVETLPPVAAVQLLRDRGVQHGTDQQLEQIAGTYGFHALSISLIGGYIASFCSGDPTRFESAADAPSLSEDNMSRAEEISAAAGEHEQSFRHLAHLYFHTLSQSDPAALTLLQRLCLFRLGADAEILAAVFTGPDKTKVAGPLLAALSYHEVEEKLRLLTEIGLVEEHQPADEPTTHGATYTVHPAVRDGFLAQLNGTDRSLGHLAIREGLITSLGGLPRNSNPSDPEQLDILEEIIFHTLKYGDVGAAYGIYDGALGGYRNLGHRLSANERGSRICTAIVDSWHSDPKSKHVPLAWLMCEFGHYLLNLGSLGSCTECYRRSVAYFAAENEWHNASTVSMTMSMVATQAGRLPDAVTKAADAVRFALRSDWKCEAEARMYGIYADTLRGDLKRALGELQTLDAYPLSGEDAIDSEKFGMWQASLMMHLGRLDAANELAVNTILDCVERWGPSNQYAHLCGLLLSSIKTRQGDLIAAQKLVDSARQWAIAHDSCQALCSATIVQARIHLEQIRGEKSHGEELAHRLTQVTRVIEAGLRIATECGFGVHHIDLRLLNAQVALYEGRAADALRDIAIAVDEGVHPEGDSDLPTLLAAEDDECGYAWGEALGRHLRGEAYLLQAAQECGQAEFAQTRVTALPRSVRDLIVGGREQLDMSLALWRRLKDPEAKAEINPLGIMTERTRQQFEDGLLTKYPLFVTVVEP